MRRIRRQPHDGRIVAISASDPANLLGGLLPGDKLPRVPGNRVAFRDGVPVGTLAGGEVVFLVESLESDVRRDVDIALRRGPASVNVQENHPPVLEPIGNKG